MIQHETDYDSVRLHRKAIDGVRRYEEDRQELMRRGRLGEIPALCLLWERWKFRLPAVEGRLLFVMPWMGRNANHGPR